MMYCAILRAIILVGIRNTVIFFICFHEGNTVGGVAIA